MRTAILILAALGALLFGGAFFVSLSNPLLVERAARELLRIEVQREVGEKLDDLSESRIAAFAQRALRRTDADIERARQGVHDEVDRIVGFMLRDDCACRLDLDRTAREGRSLRVALLSASRKQLVSLIEATYASVSRSLLREFRIFTGSNAVAFALLGAVTLARRKASLQLLLPAVVLVGAVGITGSLYLFNRDWLHTIVFGEYVGFGYSLYLAGVAALLADIAFNRARITTRLVNLVLDAVGSAASAVPC